MLCMHCSLRVLSGGNAQQRSIFANLSERQQHLSVQSEYLRTLMRSLSGNIALYSVHITVSKTHGIKVVHVLARYLSIFNIFFIARLGGKFDR